MSKNKMLYTDENIEIMTKVTLQCMYCYDRLEYECSIGDNNELIVDIDTQSCGCSREQLWI